MGMFPQGPCFWGTWKGHSFLRAFEIKRYIKQYVKMPCKWVSLSLHRGPVGEPGWDLLARTF